MTGTAFTALPILQSAKIAIRLHYATMAYTINKKLLTKKIA